VQTFHCRQRGIALVGGSTFTGQWQSCSSPLTLTGLQVGTSMQPGRLWPTSCVRGRPLACCMRLLQWCGTEPVHVRKANRFCWMTSGTYGFTLQEGHWGLTLLAIDAAGAVNEAAEQSFWVALTAPTAPVSSGPSACVTTVPSLHL